LKDVDGSWLENLRKYPEYYFLEELSKIAKSLIMDRWYLGQDLIPELP
jgi:hypothetical protein